MYSMYYMCASIFYLLKCLIAWAALLTLSLLPPCSHSLLWAHWCVTWGCLTQPEHTLLMSRQNSAAWVGDTAHENNDIYVQCKHTFSESEPSLLISSLSWSLSWVTSLWREDNCSFSLARSLLCPTNSTHLSASCLLRVTILVSWVSITSHISWAAT